MNNNFQDKCEWIAKFVPDDEVAAAWSPDGKTVLAAVAPHFVFVLLADSGQLVVKLDNHKDAVTTMAWSPDGKKIVTASKDKTIRFWDTDTWREISLTETQTILTHAAWSPDNDYVAFGGSYVDGIWVLKLFRKELFQVKQFRDDSRFDTRSLTWPDNFRVLTTNSDGKPRVFHIVDGRVTPISSGPGASAVLAATSPDRKKVALVTPASILIQNPELAETLLTIPKPDMRVAGVTWSPDSKIIALRTRLDAMMFWDAVTGEPGRALTVPSTKLVGLFQSSSAAWSPDSKKIAIVTSEGLQCWNLEARFSNAIVN